ncbi:MAG: quinoprotein relay system zinc metallohydrolase 2 [Gammaproteobacteria bacterium]|nr:quinoprotein relay system zinc metallohydrolase 2 [Gammaproteobacteria bacterium]
MARKKRNSGAQKLLLLQLSCAFFAQSCAAITPKHESCSPATEVLQVAPNIYVRPGHAAVVFEADEIANLGFIVGDRCVAVIDTGGSVAEGRALDCAVRTITDRPVCYVINTHVHPDHLLGNAAFVRPGVEFIAHAKLPRALALRGDIYLERASAYEGRKLDASGIVFPERTVTGTVELDIGGRILTIRAHDSAHTDHDISVIDEKTKTAFLGDLVFLEHLPVIDGSINGWIDELDEISALSMDYVVPGHGPPRASWPVAATLTLQYLTELRDQVRAWIAHGGDLASAQDNIGSSQSDDWRLFDRYQRRNVGAAYAELEWED